MRSEGEPALERQGDPAVNQLYDNMGIVYGFFKEVFKDTKIFRNKQPPIGIVHFGFYFGSAWLHIGQDESDPQALIFGDGWDHDPCKHTLSLFLIIASFYINRTRALKQVSSLSR